MSLFSLRMTLFKMKKRKKKIDEEKLRQALKARESLRKTKIEASTDVYLYTSYAYLPGS